MDKGFVGGQVSGDQGNRSNAKVCEKVRQTSGKAPCKKRKV